MDLGLNSSASPDDDLPVFLDSCGREQHLGFSSDGGPYLWISKISFPILLAVGTIGNLIGIVCACQNKRGSQKTFLLAVYVINLLYLWTRLIIMLGNAVWFKPDGDGVFTHFFTQSGGVWDYFLYVLYTAGIGTLLVFCVDRCIAVALPIYHFTRRRRYYAGTCILVICLLAIVNAVITPVLYYWNLAQTQNMVEGQPLRPLSPGLKTWRAIDQWVETTFLVAVYITIFVANCILINHLRRNRRRHSSDSTVGLHPDDLSTSTSSSGSTGQQSGVSSNSKNSIIISTKCVPNATRSQLLVASCVFYLVTHILRVVMSILQLVSGVPFCWYKLEMEFIKIYTPFHSLFEDCYFALGFLFLVWLGTTEKKKIRALVCRKSYP